MPGTKPIGMNGSEHGTNSGFRLGRGAPKSLQTRRPRLQQASDDAAVQRGRIAAAFDALRRTGEATIVNDFAVKFAIAQTIAGPSDLRAIVARLQLERDAQLLRLRDELDQSKAQHMRMVLNRLSFMPVLRDERPLGQATRAASLRPSATEMTTRAQRLPDRPSVPRRPTRNYDSTI